MRNFISFLCVLGNCIHSVLFKFNVAKGSFKNSFITLIVFLCLILGIAFFEVGTILDFLETVLNLYFFEYSKSDETIVTTVFLLFVIVYLLLKSTFELVLNLLNSKHKLQEFISVSAYTLIFSALVILIATYFGVQKIENSKIEYADDIATLDKIEDVLSSKGIEQKTYVSKIPYLFKQANFKIENQHLELLESIVLKEDEKHLAITPADQPYYLFINQNYKFFKVSDKIGIYARDPSILKVLAESGYIFSDYYYKENLDLQNLSKRIKIDYVQNKGLLLNSEQQVTRNPDKTYLLKGKYKFTIVFDIDNLKTITSDLFATFKLTASDQGILLYIKEISKEYFIDNEFKLEFNLNLESNYHGVEFLIKDIQPSNQFYLKSIDIEKLPNID